MSALLGLLLRVVVPAEDVPVAVVQQPVARGERIEMGDLSIETRPEASARGALRPEDAVGMDASRALTPGTLLRRGDVMKPQLVKRGEPVTARIVSGGMVITAAGRALGSGAQGDPVRIVVTATNRTLDGFVDGSGTVRISTP
ncbi:flagella basal body P-ring formation protein FlgA [Sphingomonas sp. ABOLD]|uniref:Flagella basal body P-ring formation protein FlgA n=1 Tax=Sphingomonas trueperi TaxID=53317 RepID=A0A7X5XYC6_9SPHN|nr:MULTISPECIES: flagellar basal body P-ring formation chaperone FlgA [Sphingomonas]NJB97642.1 flagella basal body P-ring formation protein FlgA [Sphingomonas trueperi]RSV43543.1 flagella basal body P-ring formation protein FlgA [Sphingomonas sp. ABOLE]RSV52848.1 flagella basal body P-ring formation protein FlgA [Sphingomonas sp. ABOLD]